MNRVWLTSTVLATVFACSPSNHETGFASTPDAGSDSTSSTSEGGSAPDAESADDAETTPDVEIPSEEASSPGSGMTDSGAEVQEAATREEGGHEAGAHDASVADSSASSCPGPAPTLVANGVTWTLVWSDEFNGPNGSAPDPSKWVVQTGDIGASNQELEYYTNDLANAHIENCSLVITTTTEGASNYTCNAPNPSGGPCEYTSARMNTMGLYSAEYGRIEARIQLPVGDGMWPAFWALGDNFPQVNWPACGEIDIMEATGKNPYTNLGSLHGLNTASNGPYEDVTSYYTVPNGTPSLAQAYHTYAIEWQSGQITFFVDDNLYATTSSTTMPANDQWEYNQPFFLILNVAVGGWAGQPDSTTVFPQQMLVDYVRWYTRN